MLTVGWWFLPLLRTMLRKELAKARCKIRFIAGGNEFTK